MALNSNLELIYHFTGDVTDSSGNSNDGTNNGATLTTDKNSVSSQAYLFNGTSNYISTNTKLTQQVTSFSIWYKMTSTSQGALFANDGNDRIQLLANAGSSGDFRLFQKVGNVTKINNFVSMGSVAYDGNWHHIACVFDLDTPNAKFYFDGVLQPFSSSSESTGTAVAWSQNMAVGANETGASRNNFFNGSIDEFRIYERALTQYEVSQLYYGYDTDENQIGILNEGVEQLLHFSGNVNDSSGNGNNATNNGATLTTDKNSVSNQAYDFDGVGDYIDTGLEMDSANGTISGWWNPDSATDYQSYCGKGSGAEAFELRTFGSGTSVLFQMRSSSVSNNAIATFTVSSATWYHIVCTWGTQGMKLYINGKLEATNSYTGSWTASANMRIGDGDLGAADTFDGKIDEFRYYNRQISTTEVAMLYYGYDTTESCINTLEQDIEALWHYTGNTNDSSGNGNNLTNNGATLTTDKNAVANQAYDFDGSSDYHDLGDNLDSVFAGDFSAGCWVYLDVLQQSQLIGKWWDGSTRGWALSYRSSTGKFSILHSNDAGSISYNMDGTTTPTTGTWYYVVYTKTRDGDKMIYVNGILENTTSQSQNSSNNTSLRLGNRLHAGVNGEYLNGKLDEPRLYSRVLTEDEILELTSGYDIPSMCPSTGYPNKVNGVTFSKINGTNAENVSKINGI